MHDKEFKVKLISCKNSFLFLSDKDSKSLDPELLIRLSYGLNKRAYFSLGTSLPSLAEGELALCNVLGKELGIFKQDTVTLSSTPYVCSVKTLNLLTNSKEDYEMLELLADNVQNTLLNQVRIVNNEQKLVIWVSPSLHVTVTVDGVRPMSPGKLEFLTEVVIAPPEENHAKLGVSPKRHSSITSKGSLLSKFNKVVRVLRLHPFAEREKAAIDDANKKLLFEQPFNVFLSSDNFSKYFEDDVDDAFNSVTLANLRIISAPSKEILNEKHDVPESIVVRVFPLQLKKSTDKSDVLFASDCLFRYFHAKYACRVILESETLKNSDLQSLEIVTEKANSKADELIRNYLVRFVQDGQRFLVNGGLLMQEPNGCKFMFKLIPESNKYFLIDSKFMRSGKLKLVNKDFINSEQESNLESVNVPDPEICLDCCNFQQILDESSRYLFKSDDNLKHNIIITGKNGSGKTSIIHKITTTISKSPHYIHVEILNCRTLKGKSVESMQKTLSAVFLKLIYYQPSVLILDDLHLICERVPEGETPSPENLLYAKISDLFVEELEHYLNFNNVSVIATTESIMKLNSKIFNSRGMHLFQHVLNINDMILNDRVNVLTYLFKRKSLPLLDVDFQLLGRKTESFIMQDLIDFTDKCVFGAFKDAEDSKVEITQKHCEQALKSCSTLALRDVQLHSPGDRDFSDIGGLEEVKTILVESLLWPAMYPNIFARSPLRLQSGILLYGPPGTGKTILAAAAAKHCNLRLISVKGPELLSKYIGASEQSVRDVFQKAQSAKPCILFFDEFDSLAPRRGHDNTGVTDRVVNQFLTQLDGVESLTGVCVLAATSRPDLLDPALLRPGRLDRQILCPMPNVQARLEILKSLSKRLTLHPKVDLQVIADQTDGYSGADLQAILYTAQLNSVDHLLREKGTKKESKKEKSTSHNENFITQKHLLDGLKSTRPSLSKDEKAKYDYIYGKFQGKGDVLNLKSMKQKTTLA